MKISLMKKLNILGIGIIATTLILLMIETLFAQFITDLIIGHVSDNIILLIIILGMFILSIAISVVVGFYITNEISQISVYKASIMAFLSSFLILIIISNVSLFIFHQEVYNKISGFEILLVFPQIIVYFGIYILNDIFNLFLICIGLYFMFFVIFLESFYQTKYKVKYRE